MANISKPQVERRGNYVRDTAFGRWRWLTEGGRPITEEVQVGNWILKPNGTKVHVTARKANKQTTRQTNEQVARKANTQTIGQANTQTTRWDDMQTAGWANRQTINTQSATDKQDQPFDGYYVFKPDYNPNNSAVSQETPQPKNTNRVTRRVTQRRPNYAQNFNNLNLSDVERAFIKNAGFNPDDARSVQDFIIKQTDGKVNLGARAGIGKSDGYWGDKSAAAFQALRNQNIFTPIVDEQKQSALIIEQPIDAPDPFGYTTSNHYGNGMALKELGFNNYAGLQAYAKTSEDQFAKDLKQRFGNDVSAWNQAKVEGDLGVSGKYRGGRVGDFGDMARSMAAWAGTQNGIYEQKQNNARMDAARQQYANKLAQQYTPQLSKPSLNKPMIGNTGINTIGNQPGLSDIWAGPDGIV